MTVSIIAGIAAVILAVEYIANIYLGQRFIENNRFDDYYKLEKAQNAIVIVACVFAVLFILIKIL